MKRRFFLLITAPLIIWFFMLPAFSQENLKYIDNSGFIHKERPLVIFPHDTHNEMAQIEACEECHHVYENGIKLEDESSEEQSCSECHELEDSGSRPGLKKAFHKNCKGCHVVKKKGPIMCGTCHDRGFTRT